MTEAAPGQGPKDRENLCYVHCMAKVVGNTHSPYYTNSRDDLVHLVPAGARTVLDVGCGAGEFGRNIQAKLSAEVWGIELKSDVAEKARQFLFRVETGDAVVTLPKMPQDYFDLITFNDVLEHTVDPEAVLQAAVPLLRADGMVLVSLPNLRHWNDFKTIVWDGEFEYADKGVLDRTHLRFFTRKSIPGFFKRAGYRISHIEGLNPTPSRSLKIVNVLTFNRFKDCRFLQYAVLARPLAYL